METAIPITQQVQLTACIMVDGTMRHPGEVVDVEKEVALNLLYRQKAVAVPDQPAAKK